MLSYFEFNSSYTNARPPIIHTSPHIEYLLGSHSGWSNAMCYIYRVVVYFTNL